MSFWRHGIRRFPIIGSDDVALTLSLLGCEGLRAVFGLVPGGANSSPSRQDSITG